ncbi:hypothetical protein OUZ56_031030 [Daphnia magna]|uniref:Uncharacterized protein n=1 Tax=Daphnia magna TaxID=35525 RepID=A0ABQ9ZT16_9CRUS|nr:hypothetical protein OUZ56_031030 [Daphnia magna]
MIKSKGVITVGRQNAFYPKHPRTQFILAMEPLQQLCSPTPSGSEASNRTKNHAHAKPPFRYVGVPVRLDQRWSARKPYPSSSSASSLCVQKTVFRIIDQYPSPPAGVKRDYANNRLVPVRFAQLKKNLYRRT